MSYNTELQNNNQELRGILEDVNNLPEEGESVTDAVRYTAQSLTEEQKAQARANIAALGKMDVSLGIASDGLIYLFVNGEPVGTGIPQGQSGDVFGYVDENNTIVLNGNLAEGSYSVKYEMADGSVVDIGELSLVATPTYTNLFDASNVVLNARTNSSGGTTAYDGAVISNFIDISNKVPFTTNTKIYIKGADFDATDTRASKISTYKSKPASGYSGVYSEAIKSQMTINDEGNGVISVTIDPVNASSGVKYMLLTLRVKDTAITADDVKDIIVTIDEPIG